MIYKVLHISFITFDHNLLFVIYNQVYKYRIAALFEVINIPNFNTLFIYLKKYYIQYIINSN